LSIVTIQIPGNAPKQVSIGILGHIFTINKDEGYRILQNI